jgi:hypothetical protein
VTAVGGSADVPAGRSLAAAAMTVSKKAGLSSIPDTVAGRFGYPPPAACDAARLEKNDRLSTYPQIWL